MKLFVHSLVKNEERYVWYSVMSVIDYVDKILLWDTGSTDGTVKIAKYLKKLHPAKIHFRQVGDVNIDEFAEVRGEMLKATKADWFVVLDGDEVWWESSIKKLVKFIRRRGTKYESIVVPNVLPVGDIFHKLPELAGRYRLAGKTGHLALRAVKRDIPGLSSDKPHGTWGWVDEDGKMIQERDKKKLKYLDAPYMHFTFLPRAGEGGSEVDVPKRKMKRKYEVGEDFPLDFYYPEVFFREKPGFVSDPWERMDWEVYLKSSFLTPLRRIKRKYTKGKVGY